MESLSVVVDGGDALLEEAPQQEEEVDASHLFTKPQELEQVLYAVTQPNNENLRKATILLETFMEDPKSIICLIQQLENSTKDEVRQVAAIYLREQIEAYWKKFQIISKRN